MALLKQEKFTTEQNDDGVIYLKKITKILDGEDGKEIVISTCNHREVLSPDSKDYSEKLSILTAKLHGQLALDQQKIISEKIKENNVISYERDAHKEKLKYASEICENQNQEIEKLKIINDEIYKENQALKADKQKLITDMVKLDENIISLNTQIVTLKKVK